ncbi:hypothetical protein B0H11DRAFT_2204201 [Mycena galericulata]|nr:hypothetical protein B0H11DRAFT_2204201 [Mycena galericulata]
MNDDSEAEITFGRRTSPGNCMTTIPSPHNSTTKYRGVIASLYWEDLGHTSRILWLAQRTAGSQAVNSNVRAVQSMGKHRCPTGKLGAYYRRTWKRKKLPGCQQPKVSGRFALELQLLHALPDLVVKPTLVDRYCREPRTGNLGMLVEMWLIQPSPHPDDGLSKYHTSTQSRLAGRAVPSPYFPRAPAGMQEDVPEAAYG